MLNTYITTGIIQAFRTKKEAQESAKQNGYTVSHVHRVKRRFDIVWIVGQRGINSIMGDVIKCPTTVKTDGNIKQIEIRKR